MLRCYWYEATVDGRRTAEQDALADMPGIKLRVAKIRPGRREGVETEIHRDLTTLARNNAISDALVVSAEEDLAQVIADVQDLGLRVTLVHIAVDGNWTISRALRQESDDIIEIGGEHLRPYVELIAGAEPVHADEQDDTEPVAARPMANGHSTAAAASYQPMPAAANHAPPAIYTAPVVAEYQRPALQLPRAPSRDDRARDDRAASPAVNGNPVGSAAAGHSLPAGHLRRARARPPGPAGTPGPARMARTSGTGPEPGQLGPEQRRGARLPPGTAGAARSGSRISRRHRPGADPVAARAGAAPVLGANA